jgi:hypothetical protein
MAASVKDEPMNGNMSAKRCMLNGIEKGRLFHLKSYNKKQNIED